MTEVFTRTIRVVLVEDHAVVRQGLAALLAQETDVDVVGQVAKGDEATAVCQTLEPDVAVVDLGLPGMHGIDVIAQLRRLDRPPAVVVLTMYDDAATVDRALRAGARGYVVKGQGVDSLVDAIRAAARGEVYLGQGVSDVVIQGYLNTQEVDPLTARERQILALIAEGLTSAQVASRLGLRTKTVQNYRSQIMDKLGIHTTAGLVRYALRTGISR